ncbi:MAG: hypothetical protein ABSC76_02245 [Terracidiphilus sp.]|jgi:hypothetical protein
MPTHNSHEPEDRKPEEIDTSKGFESSDVRVSGVVVFLLSLCFFAGVTALLAYGVGKAINARMAREDGPRNKWSQTVDVRQLGNMPNSPELQNKMAEITQTFPTPRVQTDDGNQDVADLHAREDLLLSNYTWLGQSREQSQGKVRIPIERAMELLAQRGLPVAAAVEQAPLMTGDDKPAIAVPLTNGFARTGFELDQAAAKKIEAGQQK